jgi:hypothetical protein
MHPAVGNYAFIKKSLASVSNQIASGTPEARAAIGYSIGSNDPAAIETERTALVPSFAAGAAAVSTEPSHQDVHFVSRFDFVGRFQSVLAKVFYGIPDLQGYGDKNPSWLATIIEEVTYDVSTFFTRVYTDVHGDKKPLLHSILAELHQLSNERAPFPAGIPATLPLSDDMTMAIVGDWGGDNDAARHIASIITAHKLPMGIHLGDIYYGGIKTECDSFLRLWPFHQDPSDPQSAILKGSSFALNGNHEMYSGGVSYFDTVLPAFGQPQSFFCLENEHWRLIGLDTAYAGGRLRPSSNDDPIATQWNWLIDILKNRPKRANIFLTHHQAVSAHSTEWNDSKPLRADIDELLLMDGIGKDAIFGWFWGHEHRCALYDDMALPYNGRLIGNGCIPHEVQREKQADPGCTPVEFFNKQETSPDSGTAVSSFAELRFGGPELLISYCNEDNGTWGTELWNATRGRLGGTKFTEYDGVNH